MPFWGQILGWIALFLVCWFMAGAFDIKKTPVSSKLDRWLTRKMAALEDRKPDPPKPAMHTKRRRTD